MPEQKNPYFSIVMPAYGVEKYIEKAIESIRSQTYRDWEIIVVDDCTPDRSGQIAEEAARRDERIRVVRHEKNRGLGPARNTGIQEARGEYIWFMDPDDWVEPDILSRVKQSLEQNPAEIVLFGLVEEYYGREGKLEYTHTICPEERLYRSQEELRKAVIHLERQTMYGYAWNKIYQLRHIRNQKLRYEKVKLIEDILFNVTCFMDAKGLNVLGFAPYHYAKRMEQNLTNQFVPEYFALHKKRIEMIFEQYRYWGLGSTEVREILGSLYGRYILSALERNCDRRSGMRHGDRVMWCRKLFGQELFGELIPCARAEDSRTLGIALALLRRRSVMLCLLMGRAIYVVRKGLPMVYSKVKSGR